jgi:sugar phosphate isomerase/epimerase
MVLRLRRCAEATAGTGVVLGLENHNHGGFTANADDLARILREVGHPALKVTLDTGDYLVDTSEVNGYLAIERAAPHAAHVHAKLYTPDPAGSEPTHDWPRILGTLTASGFDAYVSIEYEGNEDPLTAVPRGAAYLRKALRDHAARQGAAT